jgi:hypothetical protein
VLKKTNIIANLAPGTDIQKVALALSALADLVADEVTEDGKITYSPLVEYSISQDGLLCMSLQHVAK